MKAEPGDKVRVRKDGKFYEGILMPSTTGAVVIKLESGYNVAFYDVEVEILEKGVKKPSPVKAEIAGNEDLPQITILSTGGTIASKVDYRTGAVTSQFDAGEIVSSIPEMAEIARIKSGVVCNILSENMNPKIWRDLARKAYDEIKGGANGIVITHGTDTMGYTAAALSFMLQTPVPVTLVGAQRSSDRPSSDAALNAIAASLVATSDIAEVTVTMHGSSSDDFCYVHRGTRVRKMHTSRRDAFVSDRPIAKVYPRERKIEILERYRGRGGDLSIDDRMEERCALIKFFPGASPEIIDAYLDLGYRGLVIEGTGLGHVSSEWIGKIKEAIESGVAVVMSSQCIYGRVCDRVYDTGRDLLRAGVIEAEDMIPETALVKLMWVLGRERDLEKVSELMRKNLVGEITPSSSYHSYPVI